MTVLESGLALRILFTSFHLIRALVSQALLRVVDLVNSDLSGSADGRVIPTVVLRSTLDEVGGSGTFFELKADTPAFGGFISSVLAIFRAGSEGPGTALLSVAFVSLVLTVIMKALARVLVESNGRSFGGVDTVVLEDTVPVGLSVSITL